MMKIRGVLKQEQIKEFTRKDGTIGEVKILYIEPEGSIYPIRVTASDINFKTSKPGSVIELNVEIYPYFFQDGKRRKAYLDYYIPKA